MKTVRVKPVSVQIGVLPPNMKGENMSEKEMLIQIRKDLLESLSGLSSTDKIRDVLHCVQQVNMCLKVLSE